MKDTQALLERCGQSSAQAYAVFESLLAGLESADRAEARGRLQGLADACLGQDAESFGSRYHFVFRDLEVNTAAEPRRTITVLEFPSTFSPEAWSFTFYEGLSRYAIDEFCDRGVVELGCGNGWISIALALRYQPARMLGLDINPRAILASRINAYLNGLADDGTIRREDNGFSLLDVIRFEESDLLAAVAKDGPFDRIIGCIPQVLSPDPKVLSRLTETQGSDEALYALSNYCSAQGQVEDQFGLGLIARAVEESAALLRATGKMVFNIGGRPGQPVLDRLFQRRGLTVERIWQTRVEQARDTDIESLVEIEQSGPHRFEFFMSPAGGEPICAATALDLAEAGGRIYHALSVYEARFPFPVPTRKILAAIRSPGLDDAHSALDLDFQDPDVAEERLGFLADLLGEAGRGHFPYQAVEGDLTLRKAIADFLVAYFQAAVGPGQVFVAVSRQQIVRNLMLLYRPESTLIDGRLARLLGHQSMSRLIEAPAVIDQVCRLSKRLNPSLIVHGLTATEARSPEAFRQLVENARTVGALLVVDLSEVLDLSSTPSSNSVFETLVSEPLPGHVVLVCGLIRNRVYQDLEVAFCLSRDDDLHRHLAGAAELTYSRAPLVAQRYYTRLISDLLSFRRPDRSVTAPGSTSGSLPCRLNGDAEYAFEHPAVSTQGWPLDDRSLRMDYGENELPAPAALGSALAEAFVRQNVSRQEVNCDEEVQALAAGRFGDSVKNGSVSYGCGIAPLFAALMEHCHESGGTLVLPSGAYGQFAACARFAGVATRTVPTRVEKGFKLDAQALDPVLEGLERPWLFLNAPVANPSGAVYREAEVQALVDTVRRHRAHLVVDSVFAGLEITRAARYESLIGPRCVILGGVSKEYAAAGIRFGYALTSDSEFQRALSMRRLDQPHSTHFFAVKRLLGKHLGGDPELMAALEEQRRILAGRAIRLAETLAEAGWQVLPPEGGLFLIARPTGLIGRRLERVGEDPLEIDADNIAEALFKSQGLLINGPDWTGIPEFCRFVLSVDESVFDQGLERIAAFAAAVS